MNKNRDINAELIQSVEDMKAGRGRRFTIDVPGDIKKLRSRLNLSQSAFAAFLNINARTLQGWEQGLKHPKGPAVSLLSIADKHLMFFYTELILTQTRQQTTQKQLARIYYFYNRGYNM